MSMRLAPLPDEWIDRQHPVAFAFEGRRYEGFQGDTITSALLANGVRILGRSFKYHRPRGVLSCANHDANALLQCSAIPNLRADVTPLTEDLDLTAVNTFGGLKHDRARFIDWLAPVLPVGFYYKAFYSPRWEGMFRRVAGLGRIVPVATPVRTAKRYDFCDVLVIGAGASGLSAAIAAAEAGAKVVLVDENARHGGPGLHELAEQAKAHSGISIRCATVAAGYYTDHWVPLVDERRMTKLRARAVVVCAGVFEQPAVFRLSPYTHLTLPTILLV
jgi:sarcosine oxidase subunit alpha